jgi:hypothetical protein
VTLTSPMPVLRPGPTGLKRVMLDGAQYRAALNGMRRVARNRNDGNRRVFQLREISRAIVGLAYPNLSTDDFQDQLNANDRRLFNRPAGTGPCQLRCPAETSSVSGKTVRDGEQEKISISLQEIEAFPANHSAYSTTASFRGVKNPAEFATPGLNRFDTLPRIRKISAKAAAHVRQRDVSTMAQISSPGV